MSLILVATVGGVLLERLHRLLAGRRVGVRRGGARDTAGNGERAATAVFDQPLCQTAGGCCEQLRRPAPHRAVGARSGPCGAILGLAARTPRGGAVPVLARRQ